MTTQPIITWCCKAFDQLSIQELYAVLQLRSAVFVVEQQCNYQDLDGKDVLSHHVMGWHHKKLIAYARLLPAGISYPTPSIGRVVIDPNQRAFGYGKSLMHQSIQELYKIFGTSAITISAQFHLKKFYASLGFQSVGTQYQEDGIPHIQMYKEASP